MELKKLSKGKDSCPTYSNYCGSPVHSNPIICHTIMENYYSFKNKKEKYFICPVCKSVENVEYEEFYNTHINHLQQYTCQKKYIFQMIVPMHESLGSRKRPIEIDDESDDDDEKRLKYETNDNNSKNMNLSQLYFSTCLKPVFQETRYENIKNGTILYANPELVKENNYKHDLEQIAEDYSFRVKSDCVMLSDMKEKNEIMESSIKDNNSKIVKCMTQEINGNKEKIQIEYVASTNEMEGVINEVIRRKIDKMYKKGEIKTENKNEKTIDMENETLKKDDEELKNTQNNSEEQLETIDIQVNENDDKICIDVVISDNTNEQKLETGIVGKELEKQTNANSDSIDEIIEIEDDPIINTELVEYQQEDGYNFIFSLSGKLAHWKFSPDCRVEDVIIFLESRGFNRNRMLVLYSFPSQDLLQKVKNFETKLSDVKGLLKNQVFNVRLLNEPVNSNRKKEILMIVKSVNEVEVWIKFF